MWTSASTCSPESQRARPSARSVGRGVVMGTTGDHARPARQQRAAGHGSRRGPRCGVVPAAMPTRRTARPWDAPPQGLRAARGAAGHARHGVPGGTPQRLQRAPCVPWLGRAGCEARPGAARTGRRAIRAGEGAEAAAGRCARGLAGGSPTRSARRRPTLRAGWCRPSCDPRRVHKGRPVRAGCLSAPGAARPAAIRGRGARGRRGGPANQRRPASPGEAASRNPSCCQGDALLRGASPARSAGAVRPMTRSRRAASPGLRCVGCSFARCREGFAGTASDRPGTLRCASTTPR
jgi:hypothetical protein